MNGDSLNKSQRIITYFSYH